MRRSLAHADLVALTLLVGALVVFFWKLLCTNLILARGDTFLYIYPYWSAAADALRSGRLPLWNPDLFMGAPFLANSQAGTLYPLNWPVWLLFRTAVAAKVSIGLHLLIAGWTSYGFARQGLRLRPFPAWFAAFSFMLGGYLTAQVEHINQLQGLAWLPAVFWTLTRPQRAGRGMLLGGLFGLQLLAGHTQATLITAVGAGIYAAWLSWPALRAKIRGEEGDSLWVTPLAHLLAACVVGVLLAAAQVLPTIELSRYSIRSGGLPVREAISFSLHPLLVGKSLLPGYGETLYTEYVAFLPLTTALLAAVGLWGRGRRAAGLALVAGLGLFFALGAANPVYVLLVRLVPGLNLFRAPARWLALYAFGAAGLAGIGLEAVLCGARHPRARAALTWAAVVLCLVAFSWVAPHLADAFPAPAEAPVREPAAATALGWAGEGLVTLLALWLWRRVRPVGGAVTLVAASVVVLYVASRPLPYNHPTAPEALDALRPAPAHLLAAAQFDETHPPGRFLSMSDGLFDPGDIGELGSIYADQLDADAFYDFLIATKQKEILAPNLPSYFSLPAVDGYDGGVLPLKNFVAVERLILPDDQVSMDGRLRENLAEIPDGRWLNLFNVQFLITDKVGDAWSDGVYYDLQFAASLNAQRPTAAVGYVSPFEATGMGVVLSYPVVDPGTPLVKLVVRFADGLEDGTLLRAGEAETVLGSTADGRELVVRRYEWSQAGVPVALSVSAVGDGPASITVHGMSLVDSRDGSFQSLVVSGSGRYRLVHSGDVKIYENLDRLPRAFFVSGATWASDNAVALSALEAGGFDPAAEVVLMGTGESRSGQSGPAPGRVTVEAYEPEHIALRVQADEPGWLVLTDSFYPGWEASVDGQTVDITRANVLFRAVSIEGGTHQAVFTFRPASVLSGLAVSACAIALWILIWVRVCRARRAQFLRSGSPA